MEIVYARNNKEEAWTLRAALLQSAQPEYDSSLVLLNHLAATNIVSKVGGD